MGWVTLTLRKRELKQSHAYYQMRDLQISREKRQLARQKQYETAVIQNNQEKALLPYKTSYREAMDELNQKRSLLNKYLQIAREMANGNQDIVADDPSAIQVPSSNGKYVKKADGEICDKTDAKGNQTGQFVTYKDIKTNDEGQYYYPGDSTWGSASAPAGIEPEDLTRFDFVDLSGVITEYSLPDLSGITEDDISSISTNVNNIISQLQIEIQDLQTEHTNNVNFTKTLYENELAMLEEDANDKETMLDLEQSDVDSQMEAVSQEMQAVSEAVSSEIQNSTIKLA